MMRKIRAAVLALLLGAAPVWGANPKECMDISASQDSDVHSPSGVRVTIRGTNRCSEEIDSGSIAFRVTALGTGDAVLAAQRGRFGGKVAPHGQVETKVFVLCDPERVRAVRVEAE
jgi:hypothetical protein